MARRWLCYLLVLDLWGGRDILRVGLQIWMKCMSEGGLFGCCPVLLDLPAPSALSQLRTALLAMRRPFRNGHTPVLDVVLSQRCS